MITPYSLGNSLDWKLGRLEWILRVVLWVIDSLLARELT